jgi:hypothetical protein
MAPGPPLRIAIVGSVLAAMMACGILTACARHQTAAPTIPDQTSSAELMPSHATLGPGYFGTDARQLVAMIPGCDRPALLTAAAVASAAPALAHDAAALAAAASASECDLRGYGVIVFRFTSSSKEAVNTAELARVDDYFAQGAGWSAAPTSTALPSAERSVVQPAAVALGGLILTGHHAVVDATTPPS